MPNENVILYYDGQPSKVLVSQDRIGSCLAELVRDNRTQHEMAALEALIKTIENSEAGKLAKSHDRGTSQGGN